VAGIRLRILWAEEVVRTYNGAESREEPALKRIESRPIAKGRLFCLRCRLVLAVGDQVVDNSWIGKCRRIAQRAEVILGDLAQDAAHDLA
jgi:hypothetical protein